MTTVLVEAQDTATLPTPGHVRWRDDRVGLLVGAGLAVALFVVGWLRFANTWATIDLALFDQALWKMAHGQSPNLTVLDENLFGDHFSPAILVLVPLYRIVATPLWLIAAQALAIGLAVPAMRGLARQIGASQSLAAVATVLSAPLFAAAVFDVHPVVATVPVTAAAIAAGLRDDRRAVTILAVAIVLLRADAAMLLLGVAVLATPRCRNRLLVIAPVGMAVGVIVPVLLHSEQTFTRYWGHLGSGPLDAALHPWRLGPAVFSTTLLATAVIWLLPVGFLTLLKPRWALATAIAGLPILLSSYGATSLPHFHHAATYVPFALGGALAAIADGRQRTAKIGLLFAGLALALVCNSPLSSSFPASLRLARVVQPIPYTGFDEASARIDVDDAVAVPVWMVPRFAQRDRIYVTEFLLEDPDAAAFAPVELVVAAASDAPALRDLGWTVEQISDDLVVARRADAG